MDDNETSRNRSRNRRKKKNASTIVLVFVLIALVVVGVLFLKSTIKDVSEGAGSSGTDSDMIDTNENQPDIEIPPIEPDPDPADLYPYYYDATREARYAEYAAENPELAIEDVYWMVNCDLDTEPYVVTQDIENPDDLLLLVNKHFNLPEGYTPPDLVQVGNTMMRSEAAEPLKQMIEDAAAEGHKLWSQSGYRSYDVQNGLYTNYSARDGQEAADTYSARPGHSEHQTGLATDLNTITDAFGSTPEGIWAAENCWKYGFIIRYTADNIDITLYKSEPWHLRYVGLEAAQKMRDEQIESFEEYWVKYIKYTPPL